MIFGILIRNSLQSPGHMLLLVFNNGKSSCFELGFDFGKQPQEAFGAQPGGRTSWKMYFWLHGRCDSNWHMGMPSSGRSQSRKLQGEAPEQLQGMPVGAGGKAVLQAQAWAQCVSHPGDLAQSASHSSGSKECRAISLCLGPGHARSFQLSL